MWIIFSILSAAAAAGSRMFIKSAGDNATDRTIVFSRSAIGAIPAWVLLAFAGIPALQSGFFPAVLVACICDVFAILSMSRALRSSSMGKSVPLLAFTPVFLLLTSYLVVGEAPSAQGVVGVLVIVAGSYLLRLGTSTRSLLEPFRLLFHSRGARYMLLTALLFSLTGPFFKRAIDASGPVFTMAVSLPLSASLVCLIQLLTGKSPAALLPSGTNWKALLGVGLSVFFVALFVNLALTTGLVAYVISIKRLGIMLNIVIGALFFGERKLGQNLLAGAFMVAGAALISLS